MKIFDIWRRIIVLCIDKVQLWIHIYCLSLPLFIVLHRSESPFRFMSFQTYLFLMNFKGS